VSVVVFANSEDAEDGPESLADAAPPRRGRRVKPEEDPPTKPAGTRTVMVNTPWQVVDDGGKVYTPGDKPTVPEALAAHWIKCGWVHED
jgi:hypothetical protein